MTAPDRERFIGGFLALGAFLFWGLVPLYFKAVAQVPAPEVLAHRILWSALLLLGAVAIGKRWHVLRVALRDRRTQGLLAASTLLVSSNWLIFIWAIGAGRVLESSLGYYINPLMNMLLGWLVLRERLTRGQGIAVALAGIGVLNLALHAPGFPWVSLALAGTFSVYGLIRKTMALGSVDGLFLETNLLLPAAVLYLVAVAATGEGAFLAGAPATDGLLFLAGAVTTLPLLAFAAAVRRLSYTTVGFFQYVAPTGHFLLAVLVFGEPFGRTHLFTFAIIWIALALYTVESLRFARRRAA